MPTKIERATAPSSPRVSSTPRTAPVETEAMRPQAEAASFNAPSLPEASGLFPRGGHVAVTAEPGALWGERPRRRQFDRAAFERLPPQEQQALIAEWTAQREARGARIHQRMGELDHRWRYMRVIAKCEALRDYEEKSKALDPATREQVGAQLDRAEAAQRRINAVQVKVARLGRHQRPEQAERRDKLAAELKAARADQSAAVAQATKLIDDAGLKTDRLAQTEQAIDPNAPPPGGGFSLLDDVVKWFSYTWQLFSVSSHVELQRNQDKQKKVEKQVEQERLLDDRARTDMLRARLNEELATRRRGPLPVDAAAVQTESG